MKRKLVIYGAGGMARETYNLIKRDYKKYKILGFIDDNVEVGTIIIDNKKVLGGLDYLRTFKCNLNVIIAIANSNVREKVYLKIKDMKNLVFPSIVSKTAINSEFNKISKGSIICDYVVLTVNVNIGEFCIVNFDSSIGHETELDNFVTLYPSVNLSGNVFVGNNTEIGTGANIIQGLNIGSYSIIGAGSVVIRDIPSKCTSVGVPCKPIKYFE